MSSDEARVPMMRIPFRDLRVKDPLLKMELLEAVGQVLDHGRLVLGPEHEQFEAEVARYCRRQHAVGVGSGTDALYLALRALDIGPGDEVITTALSWVATASAIVLTGATPVFVDIRDDLNIDVELIEPAITLRTKVIIPVHFTGQMCDMRRILDVARRRGLFVVEDGAQAFGSSQDGGMCGSSGELSCFSMNPMKVLAAYGEAGVVMTDDDALRGRLQSLRNNGTVDKQDCHWPSLNSRLDTIQAAMLLVNFKRLPERIAARRAIARAYGERLKEVVQCPVERPGNLHTYYAYSVLAERRDALMAHLVQKGVETQVQHPLPLPRQTAYRHRFHSPTPVADWAAQRILCLPNQEDLTLEQVEYVCGRIREFYAS